MNPNEILRFCKKNRPNWRFFKDQSIQ
jgi:hypothetical protein